MSVKREMAILLEVTRRGIVENIHPGRAVIVDRDGKVVYSAGDYRQITYYRSASKPIQALPVLQRGLDTRYGFSGAETAIMAGSHMGQPQHVELVLSALEKAGLREEDMVMAPSWPAYPPAMEEAIRQNPTPRKVMHNCSGKHVGIMLLARELGDTLPYYDEKSKAQQEILQCISKMCGWPAEKIGLGTDGCGVPVFAAPLYNLALSFRNMACPELIGDDGLAQAAARMAKEMNNHPYTIRGTGSICGVLNSRKDLVAKSGRFGVYCIGIKSLGVGIAYKFEDGNEEHYPVLVKALLQKIGYDDPGLLFDLDALDSGAIPCDIGTVAGTARALL